MIILFYFFIFFNATYSEGKRYGGERCGNAPFQLIRHLHDILFIIHLSRVPLSFLSHFTPGFPSTVSFFSSSTFLSFYTLFSLSSPLSFFLISIYLSLSLSVLPLIIHSLFFLFLTHSLSSSSSFPFTFLSFLPSVKRERKSVCVCVCSLSSHHPQVSVRDSWQYR